MNDTNDMAQTITSNTANELKIASKIAENEKLNGSIVESYLSQRSVTWTRDSIIL